MVLFTHNISMRSTVGGIGIGIVVRPSARSTVGKATWRVICHGRGTDRLTLCQSQRVERGPARRQTARHVATACRTQVVFRVTVIVIFLDAEFGSQHWVSVAQHIGVRGTVCWIGIAVVIWAGCPRAVSKTTRRIARHTTGMHTLTNRQAQLLKGGHAVVSSDAVGIEGVPTVWTLII